MMHALFKAFNIAVLGIVLAQSAQAEAIVAAASNLQPVLETIYTRYLENGGTALKRTYSSTQHLEQQIRYGAPFTLMLGADTETVERLKDLAAKADDIQTFAYGSLALLSRAPLSQDKKINAEWLRTQLLQAKRIAIANPDHAPYGKAAKTFIASLGLWHALQNKMVLSDNAAQAAQFAILGVVDLSITAASFNYPALNSLPISIELTPLLQHKLILLKRGSQLDQQISRAFVAFLLAPKQADLWLRYGYQTNLNIR